MPPPDKYELPLYRVLLIDVRMLLKIYRDAFRRLTDHGRSWREYVAHLVITIGIPLSLVFLIVTILAVLGLTSVEINGERITGVDALLPGLGTSFLFVPFLCLFVGSLAYVVEEKVRTRK